MSLPQMPYGTRQAANLASTFGYVLTRADRSLGEESSDGNWAIRGNLADCVN